MVSPVTEMPKWIDVGPASAFLEGEHACVQAGCEPAVIFRLDGQWYALRNVCPHAGRPLGDGARRGNAIVCPHHGYAYNIKTGHNADCPEDEPPCRTFPVREEAGRVLVQVKQAENHEG